MKKHANLQQQIHANSEFTDMQMKLHYITLGPTMYELTKNLQHPTVNTHEYQ